MYNDKVEIRLELQIPQARVLHQLKLHNQEVEDQIAKGVESAINKLTASQDLAKYVEEAVTKELLSMCSKSFLGWEIKAAIQERVNKKFHEKVDVIADRILSELSDPPPAMT